MSVNNQVGHLVALLCVGMGIISLVFPYRIQAYALRKRPKFWGFENPFLGWMGTKSYVWMLRSIGGIALAAALFIELVILSNN